MALSKLEMKTVWTAHKARIDEMFLDNTDNKKIFEELCSPVYSGDEFENVPGIIKKDTDSLIDAICHIVIAEYVINSIIDNRIISIPDHSEILTAICAQLKRNDIGIQPIYDAINKHAIGKYDCSKIFPIISKMYDNARKYPIAE